MNQTTSRRPAARAVPSAMPAMPILVLGLLACALVALVAQEWAARQAREDLARGAAEAVALQTATLNGVLEKYRLLPPLLAARSDIQSIARSSIMNDQDTLEAVEALGVIAAKSGASDLAVFSAAGRLRASARDLIPPTIADVPDFSAALAERRLARAETRLSDGQAAYVFGSAILSSGRQDGAVVVAVPFAAIDRTWSLSRNPIFVTNAAGLVFLANRPQWTGRRWRETRSVTDTGEPLAIYDASTPGLVRGPDGRIYLEAINPMPLMGWTLHALMDAAPVLRARLVAGGTSLAATLLVLLGWLELRRRRALAAKAERRERAQALRLERRVRDRTRELRNAQSELVHAAKLATIGQMAAAVSHEYNQPLGAMQSYAGNARKLIERGETDRAIETLTRIEAVIDRMAHLSRTLLSFSRKPGSALQPHLVAQVLEESMLLVRNRLDRTDIELHSDIPPDLAALTGRTRLGQVFVNLINNAIDAQTDDAGQKTKDAQIRIGASRHGERVQITISDNGPGIKGPNRERIFAPFFTTRSDGHGLGLSIVEGVMRDLGGTISVSDSTTGGACFTLMLPAAPADHIAQATDKTHDAQTALL